jgi:hypothetical protein
MASSALGWLLREVGFVMGASYWVRDPDSMTPYPQYRPR